MNWKVGGYRLIEKSSEESVRTINQKIGPIQKAKIIIAHPLITKMDVKFNTHLCYSEITKVSGYENNNHLGWFTQLLLYKKKITQLYDLSTKK